MKERKKERKKEVQLKNERTYVKHTEKRIEQGIQCRKRKK